MSDDSGFDKEAERQRLREKYERDKKKREQSERMSELLLQGATMTNRHCGECGNPIFRYDGQEFCPTCERVVGSVEESDAEPQQAADESADRAHTPKQPQRADATGDDGQTAEREVAEGQRTDERQPADAEADASTDETRQSQRADRQPSPSRQPRRENGHERPATEPQSTPTDAESNEQTLRPESAPSPAGDLAAAEASLIRSIQQFAREAEESGDLGRAREYLAATREAAEALDAVRRAE